MTDILKSLGNNEQLEKVLYELLGQLASPTDTNTDGKEKKCAHSNEDETSPVCKSVPIWQSDDVGFVKNSVFADEKKGSQTTNQDNVIDSTLGRPRYQWRDSEPGPRRSSLDTTKLYSVYVGHLPKDITKGELEDLFSDIGDVADSFVFPPSNGHSYTYGFVRFQTLEEAEDAVKQKNMKVIGNRQINVEFSASTRRDLQNNSASEDNRPLLQREYPKVPRQSPSEKDEKQVVEKLKANFRRLNSNLSTVGHQNPEDVFENFKAILKILINYPMTLAAPVAEMGKVESNDVSLESGLKIDEVKQPGIPFGKVAKQQQTLQNNHPASSQTTSYLPSFASSAKDTAAVGKDYLPNARTKLLLTDEFGEQNTTMPLRQTASQFRQTASQLPSPPLDTAKNTTCMNSSLGGNMPPESGGPPSITNQVREKQETITHEPTKSTRTCSTKPLLTLPNLATPLLMKSGLLDCESEKESSGEDNLLTGSGFREYNALSASNSGEENVLARSSLRENNALQDNILVALSSREDSVLPRRSKILDSNYTLSASSSDVEQHINTSSKLKPSLGEMRGNSYLIPLSNITSTFSEEKCLSENTNLQEMTDIPENNSTPPRGTTFDMLNQPSSIAGCSYYPSPLSNLSSASPKQEMATKIDKPPSIAKNLSYNKDAPLRFVSDIPPLSNRGDFPLNQCSSQGIEAVEDLSISRNQALPPPDFPNPTGKNSMRCKNVVDEAGKNEKSPSLTSSNVEMIDSHRQCFFPLQNTEEMKELTSTNRTFLEQPQPFNSQNCTKFEGKSEKESISLAANAESMLERQQKSPSELCSTMLSHRAQPKFLQVSTGLYETGKSSSFVNVDTRENFKTPENITTTKSLLPPNDRLSSIQLNLLTSGESVNNTKVSASSNGCHTEKSDLTPSVQKLFDKFCSSNNEKETEIERLSGNDHNFGNANGVRSSRGRRLAPSFSFLSQRKCLKVKGNDNSETACTQDGIKHTEQSSVRDSSAADGTEKPWSEETANVMVEDNAIVHISENEKWNPSFCSSEFDFGFNSEAGSTSPVEKPASESRSLLDSRCPSDDIETIKLKDQLNEHVLKLENLQRTLDKYPQRRPKRSLCLFDHHPRGLELERKIHDAEILLEKRKEMQAARSSERELAYEKEVFHSVDDNPLLNQIARELKKDSIRSEIFVTDHKCKILEMKIELFQCEDPAQV